MDNNTLEEKLYTFTSDKPLSKEAIDGMRTMAQQMGEQQMEQIKKQFHAKMDELEQLQAQEKIIQAQSDMLFYRWVMADPNLSYSEKYSIIGSHVMQRDAEANEEQDED